MVDMLELCVWVLVYGALGLASIWVLCKCMFSDILYIYVRPGYSKGHSWRSLHQHHPHTDTIPYNTHCSVCRKLMLSGVGLFCDRCSLSACRSCLAEASKKNFCKVISAPPNEPFRHLWVKVGLVCDDCEDVVANKKGNDFFCSWCNRIQHCDTGEPDPSAECDFGDLKPVIVPPTSVTINRTKHVSVVPPPWTDWQPIIVIVNPKSGGQVGEDILSVFRGFLHPIQVVELRRGALKAVLRWAPPQARFLVAGGDGSVSAVLTALSQSDIDPHPGVGVLPLGTGNDLSRVLGWGGNTTLPLSPLTIIRDVRNATPHSIDRWCIKVGRKKMFAYNYMSIGVDAKVALDFHKARTNYVYLFTSQTFNYLIYLFLGTHQVLSQDCHGLEQILELTLDGEKIELPPLQALLLLNIPSWGAGVNVWNKGADDNVPQQKMDDGKFEILGINSSFHIAQLQIGLSQPIRLGQGTKAVIKLLGPAPMQVDGEPWEQGPCEIFMEYSGSTNVLIRKNDTEDLEIY